jgi:3-dehydroquinate dehydratase / shikimate dehydrogenase
MLHLFTTSQPTDPTTSPLAGRFFIVIGAGGAGKALDYGAKEKGARVVIANRTFGMHFYWTLLT